MTRRPPARPENAAAVGSFIAPTRKVSPARTEPSAQETLIQLDQKACSMSYIRFAAMIMTSTIVMLVLMYLNTYLFAHVFFSETRTFMATLMGAAMAAIMLAFMLSMYRNTRANIAIFAGAAIVFALSLFLVRSQVTVGDTSYMRAMIPHHSIAIMTSSRADISDPRVRKLADEIIYAQDKEIAEMRYLIDAIDRNGDGTEEDVLSASVVSLDEALATADLASLDPQFISDVEMAEGLPEGAQCTFTYTEGSRPVMALAADGSGLVRISGDLVRLEAEPSTLAAGPTARAPGIAMTIGGAGDNPLGNADGARTEATLTMMLERGLTVGYVGTYGCAA
ncbi:DUF305 domain-containing protein [Acuticoccus sp. M5D2P5]|uniref:DUF305 domain-containing protein n=1 Tax=Acuticoccus kalidii TaxID=2910977 RepID=UPI001F41F899|nr:DUF305 domain-containing protein [Acuticoccus kalidii]MCF3931803.1 DUF305 domain-containing protein [Acuticoccus kalidii]